MNEQNFFKVKNEIKTTWKRGNSNGIGQTDRKIRTTKTWKHSGDPSSDLTSFFYFSWHFDKWDFDH